MSDDEKPFMPPAALPVVLVVDDAPLNLRVATEILRPSYRALAALDGQKALDLAAQRTDLELILLDVMMPGLDGYEVCRRLKQNAVTAHVPVIFLTTLSDSADEQRAFAAGAVDFIIKPFHPATLLARVGAHVRLHQQERELARERARAEGLLLSILPAAIARRLKEDSTAAIAEGFDGVSVLFVDIVGFTGLAQRLAPARTVAMLNGIFRAFDRIALAHGIEKIKTIGDAYMAAAGVPEPRVDHARAAARAALAMQAAARDFPGGDEAPLEVRIGIASGGRGGRGDRRAPFRLRPLG